MSAEQHLPVFETLTAALENFDGDVTITKDLDDPESVNIYFTDIATYERFMDQVMRPNKLMHGETIDVDGLDGEEILYAQK